YFDLSIIAVYIGKNQFHCLHIVKFYSLFIFLSFLGTSQYKRIYGRLLDENEISFLVNSQSRKEDSMILLQANQIARHFGAEILFENIHLEISTNARIALVGRNGAGKSTLLKIIAGIESPDEGTNAKNKVATLGYLAQDTGLDSTETVWNEMLKAFDSVRKM